MFEINQWKTYKYITYIIYNIYNKYYTYINVCISDPDYSKKVMLKIILWKCICR